MLRTYKSFIIHYLNIIFINQSSPSNQKST